MAWKDALNEAVQALQAGAAEMGLDEVKQWALDHGGLEGDFISLALSNIGTNVGALVNVGYPPEVLATIVLVIGQTSLHMQPPTPEGEIQ